MMLLQSVNDFLVAWFVAAEGSFGRRKPNT